MRFIISQLEVVFVEIVIALPAVIDCPLLFLRFTATHCLTRTYQRVDLSALPTGPGLHEAALRAVPGASADVLRGHLQEGPLARGARLLLLLHERVPACHRAELLYANISNIRLLS